MHVLYLCNNRRYCTKTFRSFLQSINIHSLQPNTNNHFFITWHECFVLYTPKIHESNKYSELKMNRGVKSRFEMHISSQHSKKPISTVLLQISVNLGFILVSHFYGGHQIHMWPHRNTTTDLIIQQHTCLHVLLRGADFGQKASLWIAF